jgi:glutathione S-transferase
MQVPYLVDPNAGVELFESSEIIDHLDRTYARGRSSS